MIKNIHVVDQELLKYYENLEQLCGTPNIYRQFEHAKDVPKTPHELATYIYEYFKDKSKTFRLTLEFDQATIIDLLNQKKKENRLFYKIREAYLRDHSTRARYNLKRLYNHFVNILEPDKRSINGLSLNYITVLFAPIIINVEINDEPNPVLIATIQTAIFQTMFNRYNDFFHNIDRTNQTKTNAIGRILFDDKDYHIKKGDECYYYQLKYKEKGKEIDDDWLLITLKNGGTLILPTGFVQTENSVQQNDTTTKDNLSEFNIQYFHDYP